MKQNYLLFVVLLAFSLTSFAAEEASSTSAPPPAHKGMGMMDESHLKAIQEHNLAMHDLSNKILAETDPAKKEQLKQQQRDLMKAHHAEMMAKHPKMGMGHPPK